MIDKKDIKDYCKNCDVEPPAMRFKCPKCKHNPENKEIIIDKIDVTECIYRRQNPHNFCMCANIKNESGNIIELTRYIQCGCNPDCYFKQLKHKDQECEEINLTNERLVVEKYTMNEEILKLKQALDEIEKIISEDVITWDEVDKMTTQILNIINKTKEE